MPSGHEWRPETNDARLATQTWRAAVIAALLSDDTTALGDLYRLKVQEIGSELATREWLEIVSAWDSSAVTG
jgi:hypothetical protein